MLMAEMETGVFLCLRKKKKKKKKKGWVIDSSIGRHASSVT